MVEVEVVTVVGMAAVGNRPEVVVEEIRADTALDATDVMARELEAAPGEAPCAGARLNTSD